MRPKRRLWQLRTTISILTWDSIRKIANFLVILLFYFYFIKTFKCNLFLWWFLCRIFGLCSISFFPIHVCLLPWYMVVMVVNVEDRMYLLILSLWRFLCDIFCLRSLSLWYFWLRSLSCQSKFVGGLSMFSPALALTNLLLLSSSHQRSFELTMLSNNFSSKTAEHQPRMSFKFASL